MSSTFEVPSPGNHEKVSSLLKTLQESGYVLLYSIGDTRVFGRQGQIGGKLIHADPGDVLVLDEDGLKVGRTCDE